VYAHYTRYTLQSDPTLTRYALAVGDDVYMACSTPLPKEAAHIVRFEPKADMSVVHHMLLYLCPSEPLVRAVHTFPRGRDRRPLPLWWCLPPSCQHTTLTRTAFKPSSSVNRRRSRPGC